jgi:phospholipase/carboxylesterase
MLKKIGPLDVLEVKGQPKKPVLVMFHGYGADAYDLSPLVNEVKGPAGWNWYFPNGPMEVPIGPGFSGRAWFPIDMEAIEKAMRLGQHRDMSNNKPAGLDRVKLMAHEFLKAIDRDPSDIVLGGFSQGAMLATDICLSSTTSYRGLVILSGSLINQSTWKALAAQHKGMPFFQSHGKMDAILSPDAALKLHELLKQAGWEGDFHLFNGGHEIPGAVTRGLGQFLAGLS